MITLRITGNTLSNEAIALEKKAKKDIVHISTSLAMHRLNIQSLAGSKFTASDKIIRLQQKQGFSLAGMHIEYELETGIRATATWAKADTQIRDIYSLKTSVALALKTQCPVYIEKVLFERIKDKEVVKVNGKYTFKDPLLYRLDLINLYELKDLLVEHTLIDDRANIELIKIELKKRRGLSL